jgi:UDP-N-acetylmuramate dehydrogenase
LIDDQPSVADEARSAPRYRVRAETGCSFALTSRQLSFAGFQGLEWACGIPGTIGGAGVYNAGADGGGRGDVLERVAIWDRDAGVIQYEADELGLVYRGSAFTKGMMAGRAVLWAEFALWPRRLLLQEPARQPSLEAD